MRFFFKRKREIISTPITVPGSPEAQNLQPIEGEYPKRYDHIVSITVKVGPEHASDFTSLARSQPWKFQELKRHREYEVRITASGSAKGSTNDALVDLREALEKSGTPADISHASLMKKPYTLSHDYLVVPENRWLESRWFPNALGKVFRWKSLGIIPAKSRKDAASKLPSFVAKNPETAHTQRLSVVGPERPSAPATGVRFYLTSFSIIAIGLTVYLALSIHHANNLNLPARPLTPLLPPMAVIFGFGIYQLLRLASSNQLSTWITLILTVAIFPMEAFLRNLSQAFYLRPFGIEPRELGASQESQFIATVTSTGPLFANLIVVLGTFGIMRYFHFRPRGTRGFFLYLFMAAAVTLPMLNTLDAVWTREITRGQAHIQAYQDIGGSPQEHVGVLPSVVCVEPSSDPVSRIGPPLTTDQPVLYFVGADDIDLLWDREHGLTKVPRFSVSLTPVRDLDSDCPEPEATG